MTHTTSITVRFDDLDPWGHVNHARYLSYFESARIELLDAIGYGILDMARAGRQIVLVELTARYSAASGLHDTLELSTRVAHLGRATSIWDQQARRDGALVATLEVRAAFTDLEGRPARPPAGFGDAVTRYLVDA